MPKPSLGDSGEETAMKELINALREYLIAQGKIGDHMVYHFLIKGQVFEIVV